MGDSSPSTMAVEIDCSEISFSAQNNQNKEKHASQRAKQTIVHFTAVETWIAVHAHAERHVCNDKEWGREKIHT